MGIWKSAATDFDNATGDTGRLLSIVVVCGMVVLQLLSTLMTTDHKFDPQAFGMGVAAVLVGLGGYIYGDSKGKALQP